MEICYRDGLINETMYLARLQFVEGLQPGDWSLQRGLELPGLRGAPRARPPPLLRVLRGRG